MMLVLSTKQVCKRFKISRMTLYRWRKEYRDFPKPVFGRGCYLKFDAQQVSDWYQAHTAGKPNRYRSIRA